MNSVEQLEARVAPDATPYLLSGGAFAQNWTNTGLITVDNIWSGVPSIQGFSGAGLVTVDDVDPQTVLVDETTLDVDANRSDPELSYSNGVVEFDGIINPSVALAGSSTPDAPFLVFYLNTTGMQSIQIQYNLRDLTSTDATANQFALQYRIGNSGNFTNIPAGYVADATAAGTTKVTAVSATLPADANNQAQVQVRVITARAQGSPDEWVGVDDIMISGTAIPPNQPPVVTLPGAALSYTENDAATILDATATVTDPDSSSFDTGTLTVDFTANGTADDRLEIRNEGGGAGQIGVSGTTVSFGGVPIGTFTGGVGTTPLVVTFNAASTAAAAEALARNITFRNVSENPSILVRTVRFVVTDGDGGTSAAATKTVNVAAVNDAPFVTIPGESITYTEGDPPIIVDTAITIVDPDSADFDSGTLTIDLGGNGSADDRLEIRNEGSGAGQIGVSGSNVTFGGTTIGSFAGGMGTTPLVVTLNASATPVETQALARNITFFNVSNAPSTLTRNIQFVLTDGDGGTSNIANKVINVVTGNENPVIGLPGGAVSYTENDPATILDAAATVTDPDSSNFDTGALTVDYTANGTADDRLEIRNEGGGAGQIGVSGTTVSFGRVPIGTFTNGVGTMPLVVTFNAASTAAAAEALARNITFRNVSENPSTLVRTVRFVVTDGDGGTSAAATKTVNVAAVNDTPTITLPGPAASYTEGNAPAILDAAATAADPDSPNFDTGTLTVDLTANGTADDRLEIRNEGGGAGQIGVSGGDVTFGGTVIGTFVGGVGTTPLVVTLDADATAAAIQALVRNITFRNVSIEPSTLPRTVRFVVTDGDGGTSTAATKTVNVITVNENPVVTLPGAALSYTENDAATILDATATVTDPDSSSFDTGTLTVDFTANGTADDRLEIRNEGGGAGQIGVSGTAVSFGGIPIGTFGGGVGTTPLVVTFNAASTAAAAEALARNITFRNVSENPSILVRTVRFVVTDGDGGTSAAATKTVNVAAVNDTPTVTLPGGTATYVENDPPTVIDSTATLTDADSPDLDAGSLAVTLTVNGSASDRLTIRNQGTDPGQIGVSGTSVTFNPGTGAVVIGVITGNGVGPTPLVVTFNSPAATLAAVQELIRNIAFSNDSDTPSTAPRTVQFVVNDGDGGTSDPATKTITVAETNEVPVLGGTNALAGLQEDPVANPGTLVSALISGQITDPDGPASGLAVVAVDDANGAWHYALDGSTFAPIAPQLAGGNVLLLAADADTRVRFVPNPNFHGTVAGLTFRAWDQSDGNPEGTSIDPFPQINATGSLSFATAVAGIDVASVLDTPSVTGAVTNEDTQTTDGLVISRNPGDGVEVSHFQITGITGGLLFQNDGTTPIQEGDFLTFAEANAGLKFTPGADLNSATTPFFGFSVQSSSSASVGGLAGGLALASIIVNSVNDDPVLGSIGGTVIYLAGEVPLVTDGDGTVADLDSPEFDGGSLTVSLAAGGQAGDVLAVRNQGTGTGEIGVGGSDVTYEGVVIGTASGGTGGAPLVVALDADASLAAVQALIRNVTFATTGGPLGGDRTVQFQVADGDGGTSNTPAVTVSVVSEMSIVSIVREGVSPTPATTLSWAVTFSLPVMGVSTSNFGRSGTLAGISTIDSVTGSGTTWTVSATAGGTGDGTLGLDFVDDTGLNLTATNEPFIGEVYTIDRTGPTVSFDDGDADDLVAAEATLTYTLTFNEEINGAGVSAAAFENAGTAAITLGTVLVTGPNTIQVQVTPTTGGTLVLGLAATASISDLLGNAVIVPTADDTTVTVDAVLLAVADIDDGDADDVVAPNDTLTYTIDFAEAIDFASVSALDFANGGTSAVTIGMIASVDGDTITVEVTPTTPGTLILQAGPDIFDVAGNPMASQAVDDDEIIVNVPPVAGPDEYFPVEDTTLNVDAVIGLLANDTDVNDPAASLTIDTTPLSGPSNGVLLLQSDGSFTYTPDPNFNGLDSFTYRVVDPHGGTHTGIVTLNVAAISDAPTIAVPAAPVVVDEDGGLRTVPGFATGISTGPANESTQVITSLVVTVIGTTGSLAFSSNPAINLATGTLTFLAAPDTNGTATVLVTVTDSGNNVLPNVNSATTTFTVVVNPVNDAPIFQMPGVAPAVFEDAGPLTIPGFVTAFQPGPVTAVDELGQSPTYLVTVSSTTGGLAFAAPPAIAPDGTLTYAPAANAYGTATVAVIARDNGGIGSGGQDTSAARAFTIFVTPVNDPPTAVDDTATVVRGTGPTTINVIANDSIDPDQGESLLGVIAITQAGNGRVTLTGGTVAYEPNDGFVGTDTFQYTVRDSNGGTDTGTVTVTVVRPPSETPNLIAVGSGPGGGSRVRLYSVPIGAFAAEFSVFDASFAGGISVAVGDVNGDRVADVVVVPGVGGGPHVKVIDGNRLGMVGPDGRISDAALLGSFFAYSPDFVGGVILSVADITGDGLVDIITGTGAGGGAHVKVIDGASIGAVGGTTVLASFFAYQPSFLGGVNVAGGDVNGDGIADVITAAGASGGSHVKAFDGTRLAQAGPGDSDLVASFFAYGAAFLGGVNVAAGDLDGDGRSDIITGAGLGGGSHVKVFSGGSASESASFFALPGSVGPGVDVAFRAPLSNEGIVVVGAGLGAPPRVQTFTGPSLIPTAGFDAFELDFLGGVDVG